MKYEFFELPEYYDLVKAAKEEKITIGVKDKWELFKALVDHGYKEGIFKDACVFKREYLPREIEERKEKKYRIPGNTYYPKSIEREVLNMIGDDPEAFESFIFGNPDLPTVYTWNRKTTCACGEQFELVRKYKENDIWKTEDVDTRECPNCNKKWILLKD